MSEEQDNLLGKVQYSFYCCFIFAYLHGFAFIGSERKGWENLVWVCQDVLRLHFTHLLALITAPRANVLSRCKAAHILASNIPKIKPVFVFCARSHKMVSCPFLHLDFLYLRPPI